MSKVGQNIADLRRQLGWTQEELARRMGYKSKSTINKIELGINDIPQSKIVKFAEVLGTSPSRLMGWLDDEEQNKNDQLARLVVKLRSDPELLDTVLCLVDLPPEQFAAVRQMLSAFRG